MTTNYEYNLPIANGCNLAKGAINTKVFIEVGNTNSSSSGDSLNVSDAEKFFDYLLRKHVAAI